MNKTIQSASEETLKLYNLFASAESGREFSYKDLQDLTGIKMDDAGKSHMRSALRKF